MVAFIKTSCWYALIIMWFKSSAVTSISVSISSYPILINWSVKFDKSIYNYDKNFCIYIFLPRLFKKNTFLLFNLFFKHLTTFYHVFFLLFLFWNWWFFIKVQNSWQLHQIYWLFFAFIIQFLLLNFLFFFIETRSNLWWSCQLIYFIIFLFKK